MAAARGGGLSADGGTGSSSEHQEAVCRDHQRSAKVVGASRTRLVPRVRFSGLRMVSGVQDIGSPTAGHDGRLLYCETWPRTRGITVKHI